MDEYSRKRSAGGFGFSGRGSNLSFREANHKDKSIQYCNRLGCSTRLDSLKGTELGAPDKPKYQRTSFRSMSSKTISGNSFKSFAASTDFRKSHHQRSNQASSRDTAGASSSKHREAEENESSNQIGETEGPEINPISGIQTVLHNSDDSGSPTSQRMSITTSTESSDLRPCKQISRRINNQEIPSSSSSVRRPVMTKNTGHAGKLSSQYMGSGPPRYGLKNLGCSSISDVLPSCSSSDRARNRKVASVRKRLSDGESSSSGSSSSVGKSSGVSSSSSSLSGTNVSVMPHNGPRRARNWPLSRDGPVSVRTRRAAGGEARMSLPEQKDENIVSLSNPTLYPPFRRPQLNIRDVLVSENPSRSMEQPSIFPSSFGGRQRSTAQSTRGRLVSSHSEDSSTLGPLGDRDGYRHFNMEGIAEVLLALERIEQDDELTYEQLLVLETNLFLGGFSFSDQHRDMRLDIDNMTYEELLALEEKMGTVSTALSEEALMKCLTRSSFIPSCQFSGITGANGDDDDVKCSICQEEYVIGDEVGKLACEHGYHVECIGQWLRQKNWCPICKKSAASHAEGTKD